MSSESGGKALPSLLLPLNPASLSARTCFLGLDLLPRPGVRVLTHSTFLSSQELWAWSWDTPLTL